MFTSFALRWANTHFTLFVPLLTMSSNIQLFSFPRTGSQNLTQARSVVLPLPNFHRAVIFVKTLYLGVAIHGLYLLGHKMVKKEWLHGSRDRANEKILPLMYYFIPCGSTVSGVFKSNLCKYSYVSVCGWAVSWKSGTKKYLPVECKSLQNVKYEICDFVPAQKNDLCILLTIKLLASIKTNRAHSYPSKNYFPYQTQH